MSNEKVLKLNGRKAYLGPAPSDTGPIDPSRLPEGYPYKEGAEYGPPVADDSIDYLTDTDGDAFYKVSDATPTPEELKNFFVYNARGNILHNGAAVGNMAHYSDDTVFNDQQAGFIMVCYDTTITPNGGDAISVPSTGVYMNLNYQWTIKSETIHPMAEEFLPQAAAVADVTAAPTADEFNALLASLRAAGYLATE